MVREFALPDIGEGLAEAEIVSWLVDPGETVSEDQPLAEVETDKAVVEVPSPVDGTVEELLAEPGEVVPVGTVIVTFAVDGEAADADADAAGTTGAGSAADPTAGTTGSDPEPADGRTFASPTTRRLARELGVDIGAVDGSGPGGRIADADVRAAAEGSDTSGSPDPGREPEGVDPATETDEEPKAATRRIDDEGSFGRRGEKGDSPSTTGAPGSADRDRTLAAPATRRRAEEAGVDLDSIPTDRTREGKAFVAPADVDAYAEAQRRAGAADAEALSADSAGGVASPDAGVSTATADHPASSADERIPYRGVRRTIGEQMERSKYTAPHATHHDEADVTDLVETRARLKGRAEERGSSLSYLPFVVKAVVAGLEQYPILNSHLDEDNEEIVLRGEYNVGIATATDAGLMVPVLKRAGEKSLLGIADGVNDLVERARDRSIDPEEMRDGTFSITNFGAVGGEYATPIVNYPETAILGLGEIKEKPRVVAGEVVPRKVLTLSLSIDHRVVDGADAARFTNTVIEYLESPELLLLE
ncbi:dihydrolipoamide S-acyltransferase [Natronomonas moolapensis 8.8.11]|uniref:Dihydrolipoamide S-acyltransferase n=1 Tax=Natronomonas moolapensis (strain DSM 18674 / CECT 7526 / JCM 14361 / 8.8.11) TaxID=268739 RepID=M1XZ49_NATM8|nr:2-oxo acid dehydrogenase subunit E2 [Natronomonas moolapensis]CCQ35424.1 dihydrolipoamide S-acyltransferase [Natronomonas moolapensis 8.8.11]